MCSLLEYLVAQSLAGKADKIKATSVAIDVFGRDATFDQQSDPIVRVEAGRLRNRLAEYYNGDGSTDPLLIDIPKGAYAPHFTVRSQERTEAEQKSDPTEAPSAKQRRNILIAFASGLVLATLAAFVLRQYDYTQDTQPQATISENRP